MADKIKRLFLSASSLWTFLKQAATSNNKIGAFRNLKSGLADSAAYRIWKRFYEAQSVIRTALATLCQPPKMNSGSSAALTLAHLEKAFRQNRLSPISAFQVTLQTFFV